MNTKIILPWVLATAIGLVFLSSAVGKFLTSEDTLAMAADFGISATTLQWLGVLELVSVVLFFIPRTGILGTLMLSAFMGGAIASQLEHGLPISSAVVILVFVWVAAAVRFPELTRSLLGRD